MGVLIDQLYISLLVDSDPNSLPRYMNWYNDKNKSPTKAPKKHNSVPAVHMGNIDLSPQKKQKRRTRSTGPKIELHRATDSEPRSFDFHPPIGYPDGYVLHDSKQYANYNQPPMSYPSQYQGHHQHPIGYPDASLPQYQQHASMTNLDSLSYHQETAENYHSMPAVSQLSPLVHHNIPPEVQTSELSSSHFRAQQKDETESKQESGSPGSSEEDPNLIERVETAEEIVEKELEEHKEEPTRRKSGVVDALLLVNDEDDESGVCIY